MSGGDRVGRPKSLPIVWKRGSNDIIARDAVRIVTPNDDAVKSFGASAQRHDICGNCKHFDLRKGQQEMMRQRFAERLVREEGWKLKHLGAPIEYVGLCGASNGEMATTTVTIACDQFRERRGRIE